MEIPNSTIFGVPLRWAYRLARGGYAYDAAWNLNRRTHNALVQTFGVNNLNELTNAKRDRCAKIAKVK